MSDNIKKRGFGSMNAEQRSKIAAMGGKASKGGGRPRKLKPKK